MRTQLREFLPPMEARLWNKEPLQRALQLEVENLLQELEVIAAKAGSQWDAERFRCIGQLQFCRALSAQLEELE